MNIAIINVKDLFKYILKLCFILFVVLLIIKGIKSIVKIKNNINIKETVCINEKYFLKCLDLNISLMSYKTNKNSEENIFKKNQIISLGTGILDKKFLKDIDLVVNKKELTVDDVEEIKNNTSEIKEVVKVEDVLENNIIPKVTNSYGTVKIDNQGDYEITEDILTPDVEITNKKDILIYHTHTCESYTPSEAYNYEMTGNYRTTDLNYSVARVGTELTNLLQNKGFNVEHNTTYHDYPAYSGSYSRALTTVQNLLVGKDTEIVIDLHRDAVGSSNSYAPTIKINGKSVAQMMFVMGTDGGGLEHPNWKQNLKIAVKIQEKANEMYPGLFRPIIIRNSRYNQHVAKGACIIEVGATGNTMDECILSMQCLANVLEEICMN